MPKTAQKSAEAEARQAARLKAARAICATAPRPTATRSPAPRGPAITPRPAPAMPRWKHASAAPPTNPPERDGAACKRCGKTSHVTSSCPTRPPNEADDANLRRGGFVPVEDRSGGWYRKADDPDGRPRWWLEARNDIPRVESEANRAYLLDSGWVGVEGRAGFYRHDLHPDESAVWWEDAHRRVRMSRGARR